MNYLKDMKQFILLSIAVHIVGAFISAHLIKVRQNLPPISITFIETAKKNNSDFPSGKVVETEAVKESKEPSEADLLSTADSKAGKILKSKIRTSPPVKVEKGAKEARGGIIQKKEKQDDFLAKASIEKNVVKSDIHTPIGKGLPFLEESKVDEIVRDNPVGFYDTGEEAIISLNTKKFEYASYFLKIKRGVESAWYYPGDAISKGLGGTTLLRFTLLASGELDGVTIVGSAGAESLDTASIDAVNSAAPFEPFPKSITQKKLHIVVHFSYQPTFNQVESPR